jgi:hypothetical protein
MDLRHLSITPDLLKLIAEIDEFKGAARLRDTAVGLLEDPRHA